MPETQELLQLALRAADLAEEVILRYYQTDIGVDWKPDRTPVTIADKAAEEAVRAFALQETPGFGFIGEEFGIENPEAEYKWILDPIDGTKSFIHGVPLFGTLIALYRKGEPLVGIIRLPALRSTLYASAEGGAWLDGKQVRCSSVNKLSEALVLCNTINTRETCGYGEWFANLRRSAGLYRGWGDCYGYYLVAGGRAEVMMDPIASLWDLAPLPVIFREAGGSFSSLTGQTGLFLDDGTPAGAIYEGFTGFACNNSLKISLPSPIP
jgi:myo-inositol-1(or 4)-monophosphatase